MKHDPVRVLVVDDDPDWLEIMIAQVKTGLGTESIESTVETCSQFVQAFQALSSQDWDLLVTDIALRSDSDSFGQQLIVKAWERGVPRILVSNHASGAVIYECINKYNSGFVNKEHIGDLAAKVFEKIRSEEPVMDRSSDPIPKRDQMFLCYAREDEEWMDRIRTHLIGARLEVQTWCDRDIEPGQKWDQKIRDAIERSCVTVMLVSDAFLSSEYIERVELPLIMELSDNGPMIATWVAVRPSVVSAREEIYSKQCLNRTSRPLSQLGEKAEVDSELTKIALAIIDLVKKQQAKA